VQTDVIVGEEGVGVVAHVEEDFKVGWGLEDAFQGLMAHDCCLRHGCWSGQRCAEDGGTESVSV